MPVKMKKIGSKIRVVDVATGKPSKRPPAGRKRSLRKPVDSGGFSNASAGKAKARAMTQAINISMMRREGRSVPRRPGARKRK